MKSSQMMPGSTAVECLLHARVVAGSNPSEVNNILF